MVKLVVLYNQPDDPAAFDAHYFNKHVPLVEQIPGLMRNEVAKGVGDPFGGPSAYYLIAELHFESADALQSAMGTQEGQATAADLGNFAQAGATLFIADIVD
jgi:uncharacterized protein (TIGR02118 family)